MRQTRGLGLVALVAVVSVLLSAAPASATRSDIDIVLSGVVSVDHADAFDQDRSAEYPMIEIGDERLALVGRGVEDLHPGTRVRVRGRRAGSSFVVADEKGSIAIDTS